jgi:hypothetical protein
LEIFDKSAKSEPVKGMKFDPNSFILIDKMSSNLNSIHAIYAVFAN